MISSSDDWQFLDPNNLHTPQSPRHLDSSGQKSYPDTIHHGQSQHESSQAATNSAFWTPVLQFLCLGMGTLETWTILLVPAPRTDPVNISEAMRNPGLSRKKVTLH